MTLGDEDLLNRADCFRRIAPGDLLCQVDASLNRSRATRLLKGVLLPVWILLAAVVNALGWLFDKLDGTNAFYSNVLMLARKK